MAIPAIGEAARSLAHYLELALGDKITADMRAEIRHSVNIFEDLERDLRTAEPIATAIRRLQRAGEIRL